MLSVRERFWKKVDVKGHDECWLWTAAQAGGRTVEYGVFRLSKPRRMIYAHRFVFHAEHGYLPLVVRHTCDTPLCCNPAHLLSGTQADNVQDMVDRNGANVQSRKLTDDQVREIRTRLIKKELHRVIATSYGVCREVITNISLGKTYRWVM